MIRCPKIGGPCLQALWSLCFLLVFSCHVLAGMSLVLPVCMAIFPKWFLGRRAVPGFYAINLSMLLFMTLGIVDYMLV